MSDKNETLIENPAEEIAEDALEGFVPDDEGSDSSHDETSVGDIVAAMHLRADEHSSYNWDHIVGVSCSDAQVKHEQAFNVITIAGSFKHHFNENYVRDWEELLMLQEEARTAAIDVIRGVV
jgi:hypothetical protein